MPVNQAEVRTHYRAAEGTEEKAFVIKIGGRALTNGLVGGEYLSGIEFHGAGKKRKRPLPDGTRGESSIYPDQVRQIFSGEGHYGRRGTLGRPSPTVSK